MSLIARFPLSLLMSVPVVVAACDGANVADDSISSSDDAIQDRYQDGPATEFPEAVQIIINDQSTNFCTGVLVSPTIVLGAGRCTADPPIDYKVIAPNANHQESRATQARGSWSRDYDSEVTVEDAVTLKLDTPIKLSAYPKLRDVGVLGAGRLQGISVGRLKNDSEAPLVKSKSLSISGGEARGYDTGLITPYVWSDGDTGGPLFLASNGEASLESGQHVLIAMTRSFEPEHNYNFYTRITPKVQELIRLTE